MTLINEKSLNGRWELRDEILTYDSANALHLSQESSGWIVQPVPGDIHQGLIAAGRIREPLEGLNFEDCAWTEKRSWWFRKKFSIPAGWLKADVVELELNGLDSSAEVFMNGSHVGSHSNAFRPFIADVKSRLAAGENVLLVRLSAGVENVSDADVYSTDGITATTEAKHCFINRGDIRRAFVRKPQYSFGWDWSPRVATTAIAGDVRIRAIKTACIRDCLLRPMRHGDKDVIVRGTVVVDCLHPYGTSNGTVTLTLTDADGRRFSAETKTLLRSGCNFVKLRIPIDKAKLWWPSGLGEQHLYKVEARLQVGRDAMDYPAFEYGIRFVELDTNEKFAVVINCKKVLCKGANWIPTDAIYARATDERYWELIRQARDANFNMLRIWGGGWYERDAFYLACDRLGIMLWHDFMFACSTYPENRDWFRTEVEKEADYQTKRLSRHASLVLWCGCNENNWGWVDWWNEQTYSGAYLYNYLLPDIVERNCPQIPYWNGSPYGGNHPNSEDAGDHHRWHECMMHPQMEKRISPEEYDKCNSLFISEFGYVGACSRETTLAYLGGAPPDTASEVWHQHTNVFEKNTVAAGIRKHYADPEKLNLDEYLLYSGLVQGMMYQYALESMRYRPNCHGGLFWMFSDCWGELGWTIIDYYLRRKISWYFVRRAFEPVRLILRPQGGKIRVVAANDAADDIKLELECGYVSIDGKVRDTKTYKVKAKALERTECCVFAKGSRDAATGLWFAREKDRQSISPAVFRATDYRKLETGDARLSAAIVGVRSREFSARVTAGGYAHAVHFRLPDGALACDNYFDLLPGETREIKISSARPLDAADIKVTCINELQKR